MGIDYSRFAIPKGPLHVEVQRAKRLTEAQAERACRSAVRKRDRGRCVVPGCKEKATALHHVVYRSQSKALKFSPSNVCSLCRVHHALEHAGRITISGNADRRLRISGAPTDLRFRR
jgi:5-methylcytosine-specific restriction endonuclease McrA